jgi:hypothetical protein
LSKEYKNAMNSVTRRIKQHNINKLKATKSSKPKEFWKIINSINKGKTETKAN